MKLFYLKSVDFNSKHEARNVTSPYKCNDKVKEMFTGGILYKYPEYGTRSFSESIRAVKPRNVVQEMMLKVYFYSENNKLRNGY